MHHRSTARGAYHADASVATALLHSGCAGTHDSSKPLRRSSRHRASHPDPASPNVFTS